MKIAKSLAVVALVVIAVAGATYAAYHSESTIAGATITADNMHLKIDSNPIGTEYQWVDGFTYTTNPFAKVKPGSHGEQIIDIKNVGDNNVDIVDGKATIKFHVAADTPLYHNMNLTVSFDGNHDGNFTPVTSGPLTDWNNNVFDLGDIDSAITDEGGFVGKIASVKIAWDVPITAGNDIMGTSVTIDTTFGLDQE